MRNSGFPIRRRLAPTLFLALLAIPLVIAPAVSAQSQEVEKEEARKARVIRVTGPGGRQVVAHDGDLVGSRGYLGVEAVQLTPELREHFGAPAEIGVMVSRVADGSPAQSAGLQVGDILTAVDGQPIESFGDLFHEVSRHEEGDVVRIEAWRDSRSLDFDATLVEMERPRIDIRRFRFPHGSEHPSVVLPEGDFDEVIELRTEAFDEALDRLHDELNSAEWQERIHNFRSGQEDLLERLEALEERLRALEGDLDDQGAGER